MKKLLLIFSFIITTISHVAFSDTVKQIIIDGNSRIKDEQILHDIDLKVGKNISNIELNNIVKKLYYTGNFADISANIDNGNLIIQVLETPVVGDVFFTGSDKFDANEIKKSLSTKSRQIYSKSKVKTDVEKLLMTFKRMGFLNIKIEPKVVFLEDNSVDIIFNITEGNISTIDKIYFTGNNAFSNDKLRENIVSRQKGIIPFIQSEGNFQEETIETDKKILQLFYQNNGYAKAHVKDVKVVFDKKDYNFIINFNIHEGDKYRFGKTEIFGLDDDIEFKDKIYKYLSKIKKNDFFSLKKIAETQNNILHLFKSNGYVNVTPNYSFNYNDEDKTVDVLFEINKTGKFYIDKIEIIGNERTKNNVILREMEIHEGDFYDKEKIELSKNRLWMLGFFKNVDIKEKQIPYTDLIILEVHLEENFSGQINGSLGWSDYYGITGNIIFAINNFAGKGYYFAVNAERNSFTEGLNVSFSNPYIFSDKYRIGLSAGASFNHFGKIWGPKTQQIRNIPYVGYGYSVYGGISFEIINRLTLSLNISTSMMYYKFSNDYAYYLYQQLMGTRFTHSIGFGINWNQMNRARFATKGYSISYSASVAGLPKSQQYFKNQADIYGNIQIFGEDLILHIEASAGATIGFNKKQILGMESLFTLGGYTRMRGFDFYGIGPRIQILNSHNNVVQDMLYANDGKYFYYFSAELRAPLFIPKDAGVYFSAFVDAGSVWGFGSRITTYQRSDGYKEVVADSSRIRISVGGAITWNSPFLGEIGLYYAKPILKTYFDRTLEFGIRFGRGF